MEGGTRALLTIVCTFALPLPPLLDFSLGAPDGASLEALGGADLLLELVCSVKVGDQPLCLTALIQCAAMVEGCTECSNLAIMASWTPMKVVVARVWLAWV